MSKNEFRAWLKDEKKMYKVVELDFNCKEVHLYNYGWHSFEDVELMQCTGIRDKTSTKEFPKGKKIFEGDIVKVGNEGNALVFYDEKKGYFGIKYSEDCCYSIYESCYHLLKQKYICEVIGNIYENPEFLLG